MLAHRFPPLSASFLSLIVAILLATQAHGQTAVPDAEGHLVFKANARTVVVDVVVTGKNGQPVSGLHKEAFAVEEDGHPQRITSFEEHTVAEQPQTTVSTLPSNIFTNVPRVAPTDSVTVLLLDSLNTPLPDQTVVRAQMMKYLKGVQPGDRRIAIFGLGNQIRFIQGFTADPAVLAAALNDPKRGAGPQSSSLLRSTAEVAAEKESTAALAASQAEHPSAAAAGALMALQQFMAEQQSFKTDQRVQMTLDALQQLGRYLAGIPGRKNVVWFSGSFPVNLFPDPALGDSFTVARSYDEQVRKTDDILTSAEVAIYPIAAEGLATDSLFNADQGANAIMATQPTSTAQAGNQTAPQSPMLAQRMQQGEISSLSGDQTQRNANHATIQLIAKDTGGEAFFNTNGLGDALARVVDHGSRFYTLAYTPTNIAADGRFRKIQVKLEGTNYKLAYRRGYFTADAKAIQAATAKTIGDPLHPFMGPGMPDSTQIPMALRVLRGATTTDTPSAPQRPNQPAAPARAGDNDKLQGPLTRYAVDFVIAARGLQLDASPDGSHHGSIESTLVVYDRDGGAVNWLVRQIDLGMDAARYAQIQQNGVNFRLEIDVPQSGVFLRSGVYDQSSGLTGTLEIPLSSVTNIPPSSAKP